MDLPQVRFFLFGMGRRKKYLYRDGKLFDVHTGKLEYQWEIQKEQIEAAEYRVTLFCVDGQTVCIREDEQGLYLEEGGRQQMLSGSTLCLPRFSKSPHAGLLRVLHHTILINIVDGKPLPNLMVYKKPWYRDSAMMAMVLEKTDNLHLIRDWALGLNEPFDRNNGGICEPDNLGQVFYLLSLFTDASHPLVAETLEATRNFLREGYICGLSDFDEHPVYQTKWLKYGLKHLGLSDDFAIPSVPDSYSSLFWMDYCQEHVMGPHFDANSVELYPYLGWAEAHFYNLPYAGLPMQAEYPVTWEAQASQADYAAMKKLLPEYASKKIAAPHTWHASEMFLYLYETMQEG